MLTTVWAELFLFSFVVCVAFALHLCLRTLCRGWKPFDRVGSALAILAATVMTVDALQLLNCFSYSQLQPWSSFSIVAALVGYCWLCLRGWAWRSKQGVELIKQPLVGCLLVTTIAISGWCWLRLHSFEITSDFSLDSCVPGELVEEQMLVGLTDAGSPLTLYRLDASDAIYTQYAMAAQERIARLAKPLIVQAEPTRDCNCHGWVFTGGKHLLRGESVEQIITENAYSPTEQPQEDDIAIYRSATGKILHTGLVRTVLSDGTILIESKWGVDGRFLHRPENQPYSQIIEYYRRTRPSHLITVKMTDAASEMTALSTLGSIGGPTASLK